MTDTGRAGRRHDIDRLRVLAMVSIFLFHCGRYFDHEDWHVKNPLTSDGVTVFVQFLVLWIMPLFFVISGMSSSYSLRLRSAGAYLAERSRRLLVPFALGTLVVLVPVQVYIERVSHGQFTGSLLAFYPRYFDGWYGFGGNFAWMGLHLWYLLFLFVFSMITLPLFRAMNRAGEGAHPSRAAAFFQSPAGLLLLAAPLIGVELLVNRQIDGIGMRSFGGWSLVTYLVFFALGALAAAGPGFRRSLERARVAALAAGALITILLFINLFAELSFNPFGTLPWIVRTAVLRPLASWCWLVAILGFGSRHLDFSGRLLRYANGAVLPFYILHQTAIVIAGYLMLGWDAPVAMKYPVLAAVSFVAIMGAYEIVIRRIGAVRFLFGMKGRRIG